MGDIGGDMGIFKCRDTSCRREGIEKRKFPSVGL